NKEPYFYYNGYTYKVVGYLDNYTDMMVSILPFLKENATEPMQGEYYFDARNKSLSLIKKLITSIQHVNPQVTFEYHKINNLWIVDLLSQKLMLVLSLGVSILLFVSGFTIILSWVDKYKREMFVRRLTGASEVQLLTAIYGNMLCIRMIGMGIGCACVYVLTNILHLLPHHTVFHWESIIVGIILFFIMDILYTLPML